MTRGKPSILSNPDPGACRVAGAFDGDEPSAFLQLVGERGGHLTDGAIDENQFVGRFGGAASGEIAFDDSHITITQFAKLRGRKCGKTGIAFKRDDGRCAPYPLAA